MSKNDSAPGGQPAPPYYAPPPPSGGQPAPPYYASPPSGGQPAPGGQQASPLVGGQGPATTVILGAAPTSFTCPNCWAPIMTVTTCSPSCLAWILCAVLFFTCACSLFCWIPLIVCQRIEHRCSQCGHVLGVFEGNTCSGGGRGGCC